MSGGEPTTGGAEPSTGGGDPTTDVGTTDVTSTSPVTTGSTGEVSTSDVDTDGGTTGADTGAVEPSCPLPTPKGTDAMGLIVEPCEVLDAPLRARASIDALLGFAIDTEGAILVNLTDHATLRLVDSPDPGCVLTRADAGDLPPPDDFFGDWGPIEVLADGTLYEMGSWDGLLDAVWSGTKQGSCGDLNGLSTTHSLGFSSKGLAISGSSWADHPILFNFNNCTSEEVTKIPAATRGAMFYDDDVILVENNHLERWTLEGTMLWESDDEYSVGHQVVRCGDDVCVQLPSGSTKYLARFSAVDGKHLASYETVPMFGIDETIDNFGTSPDHSAILVGFEVDHPDPACSANYMKNIHVYRVRGF